MITSDYFDEEDPPLHFPSPNASITNRNRRDEELGPIPFAPRPPSLNDSKRNRLTKLMSSKINALDVEDIDDEQFQIMADAIKEEYDEDKNGKLDDDEMNKMLKDFFIMGGKNLALKNENKKQVEKRRKWKMYAGFLALTAIGLGAAFAIQTVQLNKTVVQSGMATQEAVDRSITSVVGPLDAAGHGHLQDAQTGADIR